MSGRLIDTFPPHMTLLALRRSFGPSQSSCVSQSVQQFQQQFQLQLQQQ